jgi:hypothetical protein
MDELAKIALAKNMVPLIMPEFPGITVGGAINGKKRFPRKSFSNDLHFFFLF